MSFSLLSCQRDRNWSVESVFGVDLRSYPYSVVEEYDEWAANGDGEYYAVLSLAALEEDELIKLHDDMIANGAKQLPVDEPDIVFLGRVYDYTINNTLIGLYISHRLSSDCDYNILLFDSINKQLIININIM